MQTLYLIRGVSGAGKTSLAQHMHGHCYGSLGSAKGKILDVGLDSAYNIFGEHRFFTEQDVIEYMQSRELPVADHHKDRTN